MNRRLSILAALTAVLLSAGACATLPQPTEPSSSPPSIESTTPTTETTTPTTQTTAPSTQTTPGRNRSVVPPNAINGTTGIAPFGTKAKAGAPVVELFFDYQCPACANFERAFGTELERMGKAGEIKLVYRAMLFLDVNHGNDASTRAALAASCADVSGKYASYHDTLFELIQSGYPDSVLTTTIPGRVGLTGAALQRFTECYQGRRTLEFVQGVDRSAMAAGVNSTPTIKVNGKRLDLQTLNFQDPTSLRRAIEAAA